MERIERRTLLKTTGAGVALGVGTASAREQVTVQQSGGTFTATATSGFITIDAGSQTTDEDTLPLAGSAVDGDFIIEGEINSDGTWQSTSTTLPAFSETRDSGNFIVGDVTISVNYFINGTVTGTINRGGNVMTSTMPLRVDLEVSDFPGGPAGDTIPADAENLTTESSGGMTGSASGLDTSSGSATLVDNQFTMPGTGTDLVDEVFGLPSQSSGRNWMELQFDLSLPEQTAQGTFQGTVTDSNSNPLSGVTVEFIDSNTTVTTATTDNNGGYSVQVPAGTYDIVVSDPDYNQTSKTDSVSGDTTTTVDFQLTAPAPDPGTVEGTVLDVDGTIFSGVTVKLVSDGQTVDTNSTGRSALYKLEASPGEYKIVVEEEGYDPLNEPVTIEEGTTTTLNINMVTLPQFAQNPIADPDGDGLYEDVRGDGNVNILDVQELFNQLENPQLQNHSEKFNFQGNNPDTVTILDVQALFGRIPE